MEYQWKYIQYIQVEHQMNTQTNTEIKPKF